jgi:hypothetical protein
MTTFMALRDVHLGSPTGPLFRDAFGFRCEDSGNFDFMPCECDGPHCIADMKCALPDRCLLVARLIPQTRANFQASTASSAQADLREVMRNDRYSVSLSTGPAFPVLTSHTLYIRCPDPDSVILAERAFRPWLEGLEFKGFFAMQRPEGACCRAHAKPQACTALRRAKRSSQRGASACVARTGP